MTTKETAPGGGEGKRYLVDCNGCSYERAATGRDEATRIGTDHRRETGHELVAIELPPTTETA
ncbi:hypothetical protein [Natrinema salaciae]|uniref:Uncharacterized protein n=1 Tax=Natrinema salaciae TaxID=1186196 RepID=A0A1H9B6D6_9EURY|nr:hypothetical protein [Natrinema salaciae]SEP84596.1 hypothetical protein SAMN04489841_0649 [Natrinema salaciae]